jgi:hypothetical protein
MVRVSGDRWTLASHSSVGPSMNAANTCRQVIKNTSFPPDRLEHKKSMFPGSFPHRHVDARVTQQTATCRSLLEAIPQSRSCDLLHRRFGELGHACVSRVGTICRSQSTVLKQWKWSPDALLYQPFRIKIFPCVQIFRLHVSAVVGWKLTHLQLRSFHQVNNCATGLEISGIDFDKGLQK